MPVILATQEAEIRRTEVQDQLRQKASKTCISTNKPGVMVLVCGFRYAGRILDQP
jgi:hypothetical protein